jgi:CheY-like chemotaxis protein
MRLRLDALRRQLPHGGSLPDGLWRQRHRFMTIVVFLHAPIIAGFALLRHHLDHGVGGAAVVAALGLVAARGGTRRRQAGAATLGLLSASTILVHLSGGVIEMHFHYFVAIGLLTLYQDWQPFLLSLGYVFFEHGLLGTIDPSSVYAHQAARARPWLWALVHGAFILAASVTYLFNWRMSEEARRDGERLQAELLQAQRLESVGLLAAGIAHEINTPLQYIGDNLEFLSQAFASLRYPCGGEGCGPQPELRALTSEVPDAVAAAREGVEAVARIVQATRGVGAVDAATPENLCVNQVLADAVTVSAAEWRGVAEIRTDLGELPPIPGYQGALGQAFLNLIVNAAQAIDSRTGRAGVITIRSRAETDAVLDPGDGRAQSLRPVLHHQADRAGNGTGPRVLLGRGGEPASWRAVFRLGRRRGHDLHRPAPPPGSVMNRLLFVDDEPRLLDGLRRSLWTRRNQWNISFADNGPEALELLERWPVDIVVSDFRMPGMDGGQFLQKVRRLSPDTVRVVLSGHTEESDLLALVGVAHRFLIKPCPPNALVNMLERILAAREGLTSLPLRRPMTALETLPCSTAALDDLERLTAGPSPSGDELAAVIEGDVGLASKALQLVNSSFFAPAAKVTSLREASRRLGSTALRGLSRELVRSQSRTETAEGGRLTRLRSHAVATARRARSDDAFSAGLLHVAGPMALAACNGTEAAASTDRSAAASAGAYLLELWGLPPEVVYAATRQVLACEGCAL